MYIILLTIILIPLFTAFFLFFVNNNNNKLIRTISTYSTSITFFISSCIAIFAKESYGVSLLFNKIRFSPLKYLRKPAAGYTVKDVPVTIIFLSQ